MKVFVSYTSTDREKLQSLLDGLHRLKYSVWFDQELSGGQLWWDAILDRIRDADVLLIAVSPALIDSKACVQELDYARAVGKPILPVMIAPVRPELLPEVIAQTQIVDFTRPGSESAFDLTAAFQQLPAATRLPNPLPESPPVPVSYLSGLSRRIQASDRIPLDEQLAMVATLKLGLSKPRERDAIAELIGLFKIREDLYAATARELDSIRIPESSKQRTGDAARSRKTRDAAAFAPGSPAGFYADPTGRHDERHWSGVEWTGRVRDGAAEGFDSMPRTSPSTSQTVQSASRARWFVAGGLIATVVLIGGGIAYAGSLNNTNTNNTVTDATPAVQISQAEVPTPSPQQQSPVAAVLDPRNLLLPSTALPHPGYVDAGDSNQTDHEPWRGWGIEYKYTRPTIDYWLIFVAVYVFSTGTNAAAVPSSVGCDYTTNEFTITGHAAINAPATGLASAACGYQQANTTDAIEYKTADKYALVEIVVQPGTATDTSALNLAVSLARAQLAAVEAAATR